MLDLVPQTRASSEAEDSEGSKKYATSGQGNYGSLILEKEKQWRRASCIQIFQSFDMKGDGLCH